MNFSRILIVTLSILTFTSFNSVYAQDSRDVTIMQQNPMISEKIRGVLESKKPLWDKKNIITIQNNISTLQKDLLEKYNGDMVITESPQTEQEIMSQAMDVLSRYLCLHRKNVLDNYKKNFYKPSLKFGTSNMVQGVCYRNNTLLNQEGIQYYTIPDIGTLQTTPISLLKDLWYSTQNIENYLQSNDLSFDSSSAFFFESSSSTEIVPLIDLTSTESAKIWKRKFDQVKIIAYAETSNYPFVNGDIMVAILARKWDHFVKITTPYGKFHNDILEKVMTITQAMFTYSIHEDKRDAILLSKYYNNSYDYILSSLELNDDNKMMKNIVHYYLSALWQYDDQPQKFVDKVKNLVDKDILFQFRLESALADLEAFL